MTKYNVYTLNYLQGMTEDNVMQLIENSTNGFVKLKMVKTVYTGKIPMKSYEIKFFNISQITHIDVIE